MCWPCIEKWKAEGKNASEETGSGRGRLRGEVDSASEETETGR